MHVYIVCEIGNEDSTLQEIHAVYLEQEAALDHAELLGDCFVWECVVSDGGAKEAVEA